MLTRGQNFEVKPLNIVGSSTFGRYPSISIEKTINMFISDSWLVPYAGYEIAIPSSKLGDGRVGRAIKTSIKFNRIVSVFDKNVYLINISFDQAKGKVINYEATKIGELASSSGVVYIAENDRPQILLSDNINLYIYDPTLSPKFQTVSTTFVPGYIDYHDTYFLCAPIIDSNGGNPVTNTWRISESNQGMNWPTDAAHVGSLQTKPDNTQAVIRFPSKGNMIFVFGKTVTEPWFNVGYQLFPYQRNSSFSVDYGCMNPTTIASIDELVVWLGINEKGGPVIMFSDGGMPQQITTDGIDYMMSNMQNPADSQAFIYRQDGHIFYHINFYTDNISLFYDFNTKKFFHASDEDGNYFIASSVSFFNNQYYFISRNNGNLYAFDTIFTTYNGNEIPRIRSCKNIRNIQQEAFVANDLGFTIESGNTDYQPQILEDIYLITEDGKKLITEGDVIYLHTQNSEYLQSEDDFNLISEQVDPDTFSYLIAQQPNVVHLVPRVDLSISIDGGDHFSSYQSQYLPPIGHRKNKLTWWRIGWCNDLVCQFRFVGLGRFVATDGVVNIRK
jgi:hypothetical protein